MLNDLLAHRGRNVVHHRTEFAALEFDIEMTKTYFRYIKGGNPYTGVAGAFYQGIAEFACFGYKYYDLAGYPYEDETEALYSDWVKLGQDLKTAQRQIDNEKISTSEGR
jgi:hypothetical protein